VNAVGLGAALALIATTASAQGGMMIPGAMPTHGGGNGVVVGGSLGSTSSAVPGVVQPRYNAASEYAKAIAALKAQQFKQAASAAGHVTQVAPKSPDGWRLLGAAHAGQENWKGSRRAFERALKLLPEDPAAHAGLGLALAKLGDPRARIELDWLLDRSSACGDTCPDAQRLQRYAVGVAGAIRAPAAATAAPG
jgi:regulator of sirC expression with transglutaminase-like and TPR domain